MGVTRRCNPPNGGCHRPASVLVLDHASCLPHHRHARLPDGHRDRSSRRGASRHRITKRIHWQLAAIARDGHVCLRRATGHGGEGLNDCSCEFIARSADGRSNCSWRDHCHRLSHCDHWWIASTRCKLEERQTVGDIACANQFLLQRFDKSQRVKNRLRIDAVKWFG